MTGLYKVVSAFWYCKYNTLLNVKMSNLLLRTVRLDLRYYISVYIIKKDMVNKNAISKSLSLNPHSLLTVISLEVSPTILVQNYLHLPSQLHYSV